MVIFVIWKIEKPVHSQNAAYAPVKFKITWQKLWTPSELDNFFWPPSHKENNKNFTPLLWQIWNKIVFFFPSFSDLIVCNPSSYSQCYLYFLGCPKKDQNPGSLWPKKVAWMFSRISGDHYLVSFYPIY